MTNLPTWPGASTVYSRAYQRLGEMAQSGHVTRSYKRGWKCFVSPEMQTLIAALDEGNEEALKAALLFPNYHSSAGAP